MPAVTIPTNAQVSAAQTAFLKLLSALAPTALPYLGKALDSIAKYPVLLKVVGRAADMAGKTKRPHDPRVLARALIAAASEVENEDLTDDYLRALPVRRRPR